MIKKYVKCYQVSWYTAKTCHDTDISTKTIYANKDIFDNFICKNLNY